MLMLTGYASTLMLPWRLGGWRGRVGLLGAIAIGAVLGTALGVDMAEVIGGRAGWEGADSLRRADSSR